MDSTVGEDTAAFAELLEAAGDTSAISRIDKILTVGEVK